MASTLPKCGMVGLALFGRNPALMPIRIAKELLVSEVAAQQAEFPQVVRDVFADVADGAIRAHDDFRVFVRAGLVFSSPALPRCRGVELALLDDGGRVMTQQPLFLPSVSKYSTPLSLSCWKARSQKCRRRISLSRGRKSYSMSSRSMVSRWRRKTAVETNSAISAISLPPCSIACNTSSRTLRLSLSCSYHPKDYSTASSGFDL